MASKTSILVILLAGLSFTAARPVVAQGLDSPAQVVDTRTDDSEYTQSTYTPPAYEPNPRMIIHQNAQTRAQQRQLRMSSMAWYGMSNSRPTASPTPYASLYSPVWQMPGGRPYGWYSWNRPTVMIYR
jgi:hypothetical protein